MATPLIERALGVVNQKEQQLSQRLGEARRARSIDQLREQGTLLFETAKILNGLTGLQEYRDGFPHGTQPKNETFSGINTNLTAFVDTVADQINSSAKQFNVSHEVISNHLGISLKTIDFPEIGRQAVIEIDHTGEQEAPTILIAPVGTARAVEHVELENLGELSEDMQRAIYRHALQIIPSGTQIASLSGETQDWFILAGLSPLFDGKTENEITQMVQYVPDPTAFAEVPQEESEVFTAEDVLEDLWNVSKPGAEKDTVAKAHAVHRALLLSEEDRKRVGISILKRTSPRIEKILTYGPNEIAREVNTYYVDAKLLTPAGEPWNITVSRVILALSMHHGNKDDAIPPELFEFTDALVERTGIEKRSQLPTEELLTLANFIKSIDRMTKIDKETLSIGKDEQEAKKRKKSYSNGRERTERKDVLDHLKNIAVFEYLQCAQEVEKAFPRFFPLFRLSRDKRYDDSQHVQLTMFAPHIPTKKIVFPEIYGEVDINTIEINRTVEEHTTTNTAVLAVQANKNSSSFEAKLYKLLQTIPVSED